MAAETPLAFLLAKSSQLASGTSEYPSSIMFRWSINEVMELIRLFDDVMSGSRFGDDEVNWEGKIVDESSQCSSVVSSPMQQTTCSASPASGFLTR